MIDKGNRVTSLRRRAAATLAAAAAVLSAGCATPGPAPSTVSAAFAGKPYVLLGEVHDNAAGQRQRLAALTRAVEQGWRPAIAMEQFDRERQADIDRARRERPRDADYLIAQAGGGAWQWPQYRPVVALALQHDLPLVAANLSRADAARIVRGGLDGLFSADEQQRLGLTGALPPDLVAAQAAVLDRGHCGNFPKAMLPGMLAAQAARDAVMAQALRPHAGRGAVLIAGNGHVRRDVGVPRWLPDEPGKVLSVGYVENAPTDGEFDMAVVVPAVERKDPCLQAKPEG
ncbi:ChaN family lipoprotein [Cupriavidus taiwanensis]|uniref:Putative lipoprotein n=1 Tax=Cupriavidus taiwanensis TaxID=164546 RepID=A0A7Z7J3Y8_9BURK|nr:ChaN family lipoprotein [Cupriavidus taiwanensis]SOY85031.1 putative lipoprotein [Cupriavidus taiwanensis]SOY99637.1 putative lipoprotein [Cupriavidus taiwanensis]SOZ02723.1 putative lipoprotein [Cupriavidus taiwanensis]SPC06082.1 putative lipoprotein [Cupriavidus taiwanensis]SPD42490.1 putative lipoprotein [Cupriavidus taiwanensis]